MYTSYVYIIWLYVGMLNDSQ